MQNMHIIVHLLYANYFYKEHNAHILTIFLAFELARDFLIA